MKAVKYKEAGLGTAKERYLEDAYEEFTEELGRCPRFRDRHGWILKITILAVMAEVSYNNAEALILEGMKHIAPRDYQPNEIYNAYHGALNAENRGGFKRGGQGKLNAPAYDKDRADSLIKDWVDRSMKTVDFVPQTLQDLEKIATWSRYKIQANRIGTQGILTKLFPPIQFGNPLICGGYSPYKFNTLQLSKYKDVSQCELVVPSPMNKKKGLKAYAVNTPEEKLTSEDYSEHTKDNTGDRAYLVVESDVADVAQQIKTIHYLRRFLPLAMVVHSGGKSYHAWYSVRDKEPEYVKGFFRLACLMGADPKMWEVQQFARMPDARRRENGNHQEVHFLDDYSVQRVCPFTWDEGSELPHIGE